MTIAKPSTADIRSLAHDLGYPAVLDDVELYTEMVSGMLGVYDAVDAVPETPVLRHRNPVAVDVPTDEADPHRAWTVRTSIREVETGALAGVRIGVKDSIMVAGVPMANGSDVLACFVPTVDATVVTRVLAAGAEIVGKTNNEYFCMSGGSHTSYRGPVHNPHRRGTSAGGSSSAARSRWSPATPT